MGDRINSSLKAQIVRCNIFEGRARQVIENELCRWQSSDIEEILAQVDSHKSKSGNSDPCGPTFNQKGNLSLKVRFALYAAKITAIALLLPVQICLATYLGLWRRNWRAIVNEIPRPTLSIALGLSNIFTYIKAPPDLIERSIAQKKALCVNRKGAFKLIGPDDQTEYAVLSYVWGDVMAWQMPTRWGSVDLDLRRHGLVLEHLQRLFDVCCESEHDVGVESESWGSGFMRSYDYDWMWLDVVAMPEVLEDMSGEERIKAEKLRTGVINGLESIYTHAGRVTVLDNVVRRLRSGSMIDCAVILCFGRWVRRLWTLVESRLARKVLIRTADSAFDLDEIISFLTMTINNDQHRYWRILATLSYLRPTPQGSERLIFKNVAEAQRVRNGGQIHILEDILHATVYRHTNVRVDHARILFPLTGTLWDASWNVEDGFEHLFRTFPHYHQYITEYYQYRKDAVQQKGTTIAKIWDNHVVERGLAEAY